MVEKLLVDPDNILTGMVATRKEENQIKPGELFPEFVFKTINEETIDSKNLKGSWILLQFEFFSNMINHERIASLEKQVREFSLKNKITAVILFNDTKNNIKKNVKLTDSILKLVPDGENFMDMYNITRLPTTILIDKNGTVYGYYSNSEDIEFGKLKTNTHP